MSETRKLFESFQNNLNESNFKIKYDGDSDKITKANYMLDNLYDYYRKYKSIQEFIKAVCSIINNKEDFLKLASYVTNEKDLSSKSFEEILNQMINTHDYNTYIMFSDLAKVIDYDKLSNWYEDEDESDDSKMYESTLNEAKVDLSKLTNELETEMKKYMTEPEVGFDAERNPNDRYNMYYGDYCEIKVEKDEDGDYLIRANAELGYDSLTELADRLDKIISKYDKEAYFDVEDSGRLVSLLSKKLIKESALKEDDSFYNELEVTEYRPTGQDEGALANMTIKSKFGDLNVNLLNIDGEYKIVTPNMFRTREEEELINNLVDEYGMQGLTDFAADYYYKQTHMNESALNEETDYNNCVYQLVGGDYAGTYTREEAEKLPIKEDKLSPNYSNERNNGALVPREELDDQLQFEGYLGPMYNGTDKNGKHIIRYETQEVYDMMSESALNEKYSYKETLEKELEKVQNSIGNADPNKDISGLESKRDFLMDKLNQLDESALNEADKKMLSGDETYVSKNQFNFSTLGLIINNKTKQFQFVNGQTMPLNKHKKLTSKALRQKAKDLRDQGYEEYKGYGSISLDESALNEKSTEKDIANIHTNIENSNSFDEIQNVIDYIKDNELRKEVQISLDDCKNRNYNLEDTKEQVIETLENSAEYINEGDSLEKVRKDSIEKGLLSEDYNPLNIKLFMNTWGNYNENGADVDSIGGGWMDIEQVRDFLEKHSDEEPFINDVDGDAPFEINEYSNVEQVIEWLEAYENLSSDEQEAFAAIMEDQNDDFESTMNILESGDYIFFAGVDNEEDLGRAWVDMVGGIEGVSNPENYIDEDAYRESWRETAESSVREDNPDIDEDSDEFESLVQNWLDNVVDEQLQLDIDEGRDLSEYFDYEAFGRDLYNDGFYFANTGAIQTL